MGKKRDKNQSYLEKTLQTKSIEKETPLLLEAKKQLDEYFEKKRKNFELPLLILGTEFQKSVWEQLQTIPYGKTISYKALATKQGNPKSFRAVANANGANKIAVIIPCHRVIASDGSLGGYSGGIEIKKELLDLEGLKLC
jgi:O-6-methylguanine DNA methyltransferase